MKKTMKIFMAAAAIVLSAAVFSACGSGQPAGNTAAPAEESTAAEAESQEETEPAEAESPEKPGSAEAEEPDMETYSSKDGWSVKYRPECIRVEEAEEEVQFVYTGECAGSCLTSVSVIPDRQPQEVLTERTEDLDRETLLREEGYFAGDHWALFEQTPWEEGEGAAHEEFIAAEYHGGVLLVDTLVHLSGDEAADMKMSDMLAEVLDSMEFENFGAQTMYDYVPGTYARTETGEEQAAGLKDKDIPVSVVLNPDHTGVVTGETEIPVLWYTWKLVGTDSDFSHEYSIEGDSLYLEMDGEWIEYQK